jgi:UV excision repair protein RAD23
MKISIRTLKQEKFEFNCEPTDTIEHLKQLIYERLHHEKEWQTLIFSGNLLSDDKTIESCKITEKDFLVLMVKKPAAKKPTEQSKPIAEQPKPEQPKQEPIEKAPEPKPAEQSKTEIKPTVGPASAAPTVGQGNEFEKAVSQIVEMGFSRDLVLQAMQACYNNPDRAIELLTGEYYNQEDFQGGPEDDELDYEDGEGEEGTGVFDALKDTPHFQQLRVLARQNPAMLEQVLSQLPRNIVQVITENQTEFIRLLQEEPVIPGGHPGSSQGPVPSVAAPAPTQQGAAARGIPQGVQVRVTNEDQAIIQNLMDMTGCDKNKVMQAYFLFEKDVEMTANYLLNHGFDDDMGGFGQ